MRSLRVIGSWLTCLLFLSGLVAPRLLAAISPECPMMRAERERLCHATPKPEPTQPSCCARHESQIARTETLSGSCCCDMTSAPERKEVPALLTVVSDPVVLLPAAVTPPTPRVAVVDGQTREHADETAPRGPPLRSSSPRAPPLS